MRKKCVLTIVLMIVLSVVGYILYLAVFREKNVFDQMYYTRVHTHFNWWNPGNFKGMFANMKQLEGTGRDSELSNTRNGDFSEYYKPEYLSADTMLSIDFSTSPKEICFSYGILEEYPALFSTWYCYVYNVDGKTLTYYTNDPDNMESKEFLYTIVLRDWFEANPDTRFSMEDLGDYEFIDDSDKDIYEIFEDIKESRNN